MELTIDENILKAYGFNNKNIKLQQIGSGHINRTYLLTNTENGVKYVLQNINTAVFKDPHIIATNIEHVANYLKEHFPTYLFPAPLSTTNGKTMVEHGGECWRLIPFIDNSVALDTLTSPKQAYEAAKQFGKLSRLLDSFDSNVLCPSIIGFHDLELRYQQFIETLPTAATKLHDTAKDEIDAAIDFKYLLKKYQQYKNREDFPTRVMHHDTKISNVLLDDMNYGGICVIDLDTLMPGKFISDLGDMMRTYLCEFSENEKDLDKITIRIEYFSAMIDGYLSEMGEILTDTEKEMILFSGKYIIYMQALRFLTDYLKGSIYYPINYPEQNLDRAKNQLKLLHELIKNEEQLQQLIETNLVKKHL